MGVGDGVGVLKDNGVELVAREDGEVGTGDSICDISIPLMGQLRVVGL